MDHYFLNQKVGYTFPFSKLKVEKTPGVPTNDYATQSETLNYKMGDSANTFSKFKRGKLGVGFHYATGHRETEEQVTSKISLATMDYLNAAKASLHASTAFANNLQWEYMRAQAVSGAQTMEHVDNFRGNSFSYVLFHSEHFQGMGGLPPTGLAVRMFPQFRTSVVTLKAGAIPGNIGIKKGALFVPFGYKQGHYLQMIGEDPEVEGRAARFLFDWKVVDMLEPFAELDFIVAGVKEGKLQTAFLWDENEVLESPSNFNLTPINVAFNQAKGKVKSNGKMVKPRNMEVYLSCSSEPHVNGWMRFQAWRFIHRFYGEPDVPRTHVFFALVREVIAGASYRMHAVKRGKNYIDVPGVEDDDEEMVE